MSYDTIIEMNLTERKLLAEVVKEKIDAMKPKGQQQL